MGLLSKNKVGPKGGQPHKAGQLNLNQTFKMQTNQIRFFRPTGQIDTPYYNLGDLVTFFVTKGIIRPGEIKPKKGKKWLKIAEDQVYFHWATMDTLMPQFRKLLVKPSDWTNKQSLFRKIYFEVDDPNHWFQGFGREEVTQFFHLITNQNN